MTEKPAPAPAAPVDKIRCIRCGSTKRTEPKVISEQAHAGLKDGKPYTHIVRQFTTCKLCGQTRIAMVHEDRRDPAEVTLAAQQVAARSREEVAQRVAGLKDQVEKAAELAGLREALHQEESKLAAMDEGNKKA